ncbi:GNAT family N-acetyltransferase [uncultured Duncaniella sp.]|uniref:GNAT family N-acetyltransferase n=1 Tax=uncultured Duncaniella sp. TaxID=2768039 RepID=UPI0025F3A823|nr:GNAT family N-acetyltransferase [uncultured Duncaniella sp.]
MLTDGTISLRALEIIDVDTLYRWENDPALWSVGITLAPYSRKQLWDYVNNYDSDIYAARQLRLMITLNATGETIGTLDLFDFDAANSRCGIGILIATEYQKSGYGLRTLDLAAEYCRKTYSLHQLYCTIGAENRPSRSLFEKAGYKASGCLRSWLRTANKYSDAYIYQKLL